MSLTVDAKVVATARVWWPALADGDGGGIVSTHAGRLFSRDQAITALTVVELLETGYADDDPLVIALREELR
jgi:hypothetical protein